MICYSLQIMRRCCNSQMGVAIIKFIPSGLWCHWFILKFSIHAQTISKGYAHSHYSTCSSNKLHNMDDWWSVNLKLGLLYKIIYSWRYFPDDIFEFRPNHHSRSTNPLTLKQPFARTNAFYCGTSLASFKQLIQCI